MNRLLDFQHPKRSHGRMLGLFLLALPFSGIAFQPPAAHAQPAPALPAKKSLKPLSTEQKTAIDKVLAIARSENMCQNLIDLKVENATLEDVTARVRQILQDKTLSIEVRGASPVRVGFDLKDTLAGDVLTNVSALAGCKLFLLSSGLLIAPSSQLTDAENLEVKQRRGGEWAKSQVAGGRGWSNQSGAQKMFATAIAQEVTGSDAKIQPATVLKTTLGTFSPNSQAMLQQMVAWSDNHMQTVNPSLPRFYLNAGSTLIVDTSKPGTINISLGGGVSAPGSGSITYAVKFYFKRAIPMKNTIILKTLACAAFCCGLTAAPALAQTTGTIDSHTSRFYETPDRPGYASLYVTTNGSVTKTATTDPDGHLRADGWIITADRGDLHLTDCDWAVGSGSFHLDLYFGQVSMNDKYPIRSELSGLAGSNVVKKSIAYFVTNP